MQQQKRASFNMDELCSIIDTNMQTVKDQLQKMRAEGDEISVGHMFEMQMLVQHMNQLSELCASVASAMNQAIMSMASKISR